MWNYAEKMRLCGIARNQENAHCMPFCSRGLNMRSILDKKWGTMRNYAENTGKCEMIQGNAILRKYVKTGKCGSQNPAYLMLV